MVTTTTAIVIEKKLISMGAGGCGCGLIPKGPINGGCFHKAADIKVVIIIKLMLQITKSFVFFSMKSLGKSRYAISNIEMA